MKNISDNNFKVIDSPRRLGDPVKVVANAEKIKTLLHWQPKFNDIELICKNSLEWQKKFIDDQQ